MSLSLAPAIPVEKLKKQFAERGRVEILPFLDPRSAAELRAHLAARDDWRLVLNAGDKVFEIERSVFTRMGEAERSRLDAMVLKQAAHDFQYRFETIRVPDSVEERERSGTLLDAFAEFMSSDEVLALLRDITGESGICFADAQGTSYAPGHFLTRHDDNVEGKNRKAAYVLGLTPGWRAEWGGLLMFHSGELGIEEGFVPAMGALRIFRVPAQHSVSYVTPIAPEPRVSVTGWLRTARPSPGA